MLYKAGCLSLPSIFIISTAARLNVRADSSLASSSARIAPQRSSEAVTSSPTYNPNDLLPAQMSSLYEALQVSPRTTSSPTIQAILYDSTINPSALITPMKLLNTPVGSFSAAATPLVGGLAGTSTGIFLPPQIINPLTAAPPPAAAPTSYLRSVPVNEYYFDMSSSPPYPIANATGLGISPGNATGIVPFTGQGCGRWELLSRWKQSMMACTAVVLLARLFL